MLAAPSPPGELIRDETLPSYGLNVSSAAILLQVTRAHLHRVLNAQAALTPEMAVKFEKAFGVSAELLLTMQARYDLARLRAGADVAASIERQVLPAN